jgi:putative membrane protein
MNIDTKHHIDLLYFEMRSFIMIDWILRFVKGAIIGIGFLLPGISGGALATIFGLYQRIVSFIANITKNFLNGSIYFLPVGLGGLVGVFILAHPLSYLLTHYEPYVIWGFIGCIIGVFPALWKETGKYGRSKKHYGVLGVSAIFSFCILSLGENFFIVALEQNIFSWLFIGFILALVIIIPGISSTNFLIYFGMYEHLVNGIKDIDLAVLAPLCVGVFASIYPLSKLINHLLKKAYTTFFHFIIGLVVASTMMIIPRDFDYLSHKIVFCVIVTILGFGFGLGMSKLETIKSGRG